jgi:hypothetical protein
MGYPKETKGYYFYLPSENKVFVARNGVFLEREFISKEDSGSKIHLEEIQDPQTTSEPTLEVQAISRADTELQSLTQGPRRSSRVHQQLERYGFLVIDDHHVELID